MPAQQWKPGAPVTWLLMPRGGWGYALPIDAVVVRASAVRVRIRAALAGGGEKETAVSPDRLRVRTDRRCPFCKGKRTAIAVDAINPDGTVENPRRESCMVCNGYGRIPIAPKE